MAFVKEAYEQNYQQFRSLNQIMWQIPVLSMTLTGGLWFGVSKLDDNPMLVTVLLLTASVGNLILSAVLLRFRHVMKCYLDWLRLALPEGFVDASDASPDGSSRLERFCRRDKTVRTLFLSMLVWAAGCSFVILLGYWNERLGVINLGESNASVKFYDEHAVALADGYESISFEKAYPFLTEILTKPSMQFNVLDIGAGTGRDAAWISEKNHSVVAVEPSSSMLSIAKRLHGQEDVVWVQDALPELMDPALRSSKFDIVLLNAVWMHISPRDRAESFSRIRSLLKPRGRAFVSLRLGPADPERGMYVISGPDFVLDAEAAGFSVTPRGDFEDLLGRPEVSWKVFELKL